MNRPLFGSDNYSGVHPEIMDAIVGANEGSCLAYGIGPWTYAGEKAALSAFGAPGTAFLTVNGTGTNIFALAMLLRSWEGVLCATSAHINTDETGAIEHVLSKKLVTIPTDDGKLTVDMIEPYLNFGNQHHIVTRVLSISNLTELGTAYTPEEIRTLADFAHDHGMYVHLDGSRVSNAAAEQGVTIAELTGLAGVDALSLGATKNGAMCAEAVVFSEAIDATYGPQVRKQNLQLLSKSRFLGVQLSAMYGTDLWKRCATAANSAARAVEEGLLALGIHARYERGGNELFVAVPSHLTEPFEETFGVHLWEPRVTPDTDVVRIVTAFDTTDEDVAVLLDWVAERLG